MTTDASTRSPLALFRDPEFAALASVRFARGFTYATVIIALALYADQFMATGLVAGLFGSAYAFSRLVLVAPVGRRIDVGDAKRFLLLGLGLYVITLIGYPFVAAAEHVIALRALQGGGAAIVFIAGTAVVGQISPDDERGLWIGAHNQVKSLSSLTGDLAGGALLYRFGFDVTYGVLLAVTAVAAVAIFAVLRTDPGETADPDERTGVGTLRTLLRRRAIRALVVFRFGFSFGKMAVVLFLPIFARTAFGMNAVAIGGILAGGRITKAVAQGHVGSLVDRIGHHSQFVVGGTVLYALGTALIPLAIAIAGAFDPATATAFGYRFVLQPAFVWLFGAYALLGLADSLRVPTSTTLFVEEGTHYDAVAGSLSLRSLSWQIGAIVGPVAAGGLLDALSFRAAFLAAAAVMVAAGGAFVRTYAAEPAPAAAHADD